MRKSRIVVGAGVYRLVEAADPLEEEGALPAPKDDSGSDMVKELRESPAGEWEKYKQPIIVQIRNSYGLPVGSVRILNPTVKDALTAPQYGFMITGHVKFFPEAPPEVREEHGLPPYQFEAYITPGGELVSSVRIIGSEG
jgi:hypothetical protein